MTTIRKPYDDHPRLSKDFPNPSRTLQSMAKECDINVIMSKYWKNGLVTHVNAAKAQFADLPSDLDFKASMDLVLEATNSFQALPGQLRAKFDNDPAKFLAFVDDPSNIDELVTLGLAEKRPVVAPATLDPDPSPTPTPDPEPPVVDKP